LNLDIEDGEIEKNHSKLDLIEEEEKESSKRQKETKLKLLDGEDNNEKDKLQNEDDSEFGVKRLNQTDLDFDDSEKNKAHNGKVDKIDTFYRSGDRKKTEHNWDNLNDRSNSINLNIQKAIKSEEALNANKFKNAGEQTIDYRKLKEEFDAISRGQSGINEDGSSVDNQKQLTESDDEGSFKVIEVSTRGFDFGIKVMNLLYQKETKPKEIYHCVAEELASHYKAYSVFYTYKLSEKKHIEIFDSFTSLPSPLMNDELRDWWLNHKKNDVIFSEYFSKSMSTWICREISEKNSSNGFWEDVELPSWAQNELTNKKVELVFPYFDGVDRMGAALLFFPNGLNPKDDKGIEVSLEMARSVLLDSIQRKSNQNINDEKKSAEEIEPKEKGGLKNIFSNLFGRNKAS